jgi:hypothetical protein
VSASSDLARLEAIIDASGVPGRIEMLLPIGVRPRQLSVRTLLLGTLITLADERPAHLVRIHQALIGLPEADRRRLGVIASWKTGPHELTYRQTERTFSLVDRALSKQHSDGKPSQILSEIMDRLLEGSVKVLGVSESRALAIDWTGYESFARPPRRRRAHAEGPETQTPQSTADCADNAGATEVGSTEQAEQGSCADPEAAWGHRKTNNPGTSETFFGYYLQAATIVKEESGPDVPELVRRITLSSCKHDPPEQIVPVLKRMASEGIELGDLLGDSGYSYRAPETFALPARAAGAKLIIDLHPNDRGMKGTHEGAICANGSLYCPATPKALLELSPLQPGASEQQTQEHDRRCDELARYKLSPLTATDQDGYRRAICPAAAGKIRCPHRPASIALSHEHPTITSPPEHPPTCCVQQTITIPPSVNAKTAQKHDYPSKAHRASYARRSAAERSFSQVCDPASNDIKRGWCRLMGITPNALMLSCAFIIANIRVTDAHAARQAENQRRAACGLAPRQRRKRRRTTPQPPTNANAPPAIAA